MNSSTSIVLKTINPVDPKEIHGVVKQIGTHTLCGSRNALALLASPADGDFRVLAISKDESLVDGFDLQALPFVQVHFDGLDPAVSIASDASGQGSQLGRQMAEQHAYVMESVKAFGRQLANELQSEGEGKAGIGVYYSDLGHMAQIGDLEWLAGPKPLSAIAIGKRRLIELRQFADKYDFYYPYLFEVKNGRIVAVNICNYALNIGGTFLDDLRRISNFVSSFSPDVVRILFDKGLGKLNSKISQQALEQIAEMFPTATITYLSDAERSAIEAGILKLRQTGKGRWLDGK